MLQVTVSFDGIARVGEALAIILQFIDAEWCVQQRLVRVQMLPLDQLPYLLYT